MVIFHMEGDAVVAIPAVKDSLFCVTGYGACFMEWALRVVWREG